ncbi:hypothetical protein PAXINDRAFT_20504 [Paxillus involutus ATCC 200175]|uniref:Uncharacterized protein n=1 Tax=Paxillus involutus ATCC 200175 TaxID=664439 RepID=A0A0C9SUV3_PAXIN|nr:hypothetical protein PAXINDRAFT_20504 [Paxillus involutus ATCC 200175]
MFANNMALADAALEEALTLICNNRHLLSTDQCNILLAARGNLRRQHRKLKPPPSRWFSRSSDSDQSTKHLEDLQKFLTEVKDTLGTIMVTNARNGCVSSTSTDRSFDTATASTSQPSINYESLQDGVEEMTAPPDPQDGNMEVSGFEMPSTYASASTDAINTPLTSATDKRPSSGKEGCPQGSRYDRYNGYTKRSGCVTLGGFESLEGLTIHQGGTGNCGSGT